MQVSELSSPERVHRSKYSLARDRWSGSHEFRAYRQRAYSRVFSDDQGCG